MLRPGGAFLCFDRLACDERLFAFYACLWNRARLAEAGDVPDRLDVQVAWLREVGFDPADVFWCIGDRAVFGGLRPDPPHPDQWRPDQRDAST